MKISKIQKGLVLFTITSGALALGCELIVDFDRTKIPVDAAEASIPDVSAQPPSEAGADDGGGDVDAAEALDAGDDAEADADTDADAG